MTQNTEFPVTSPVDVGETAERLGVEPDALHAVVDNFERHGREAIASRMVVPAPLIEEVHVYWHGIAVVTLTEPIDHTECGDCDYALVDFNGYVFPFAPGDVNYIMDNLDTAGIEIPDE